MGSNSSLFFFLKLKKKKKKITLNKRKENEFPQNWKWERPMYGTTADYFVFKTSIMFCIQTFLFDSVNIWGQLYAHKTYCICTLVEHGIFYKNLTYHITSF